MPFVEDPPPSRIRTRFSSVHEAQRFLSTAPLGALRELFSDRISAGTCWGTEESFDEHEGAYYGHLVKRNGGNGTQAETYHHPCNHSSLVFAPAVLNMSGSTIDKRRYGLGPLLWVKENLGVTIEPDMLGVVETAKAEKGRRPAYLKYGDELGLGYLVAVRAGYTGCMDNVLACARFAEEANRHGLATKYVDGSWEKNGWETFARSGLLFLGLYELTGDPKYLRLSRDCGDRVITVFDAHGGPFYRVDDIDGKLVRCSDTDIAGPPIEALHRLARASREMGRRGDAKRYMDYAITTAEWFADRQWKDGPYAGAIPVRDYRDRDHNRGTPQNLREVLEGHGNPGSAPDLVDVASSGDPACLGKVWIDLWEHGRREGITVPDLRPNILGTIALCLYVQEPDGSVPSWLPYDDRETDGSKSVDQWGHVGELFRRGLSATYTCPELYMSVPERTISLPSSSNL